MWVASAPVFSLASQAFPLTLCDPATLTFLQASQCALVSPALGFHMLLLFLPIFYLIFLPTSALIALSQE